MLTKMIQENILQPPAPTLRIFFNRKAVQKEFEALTTLEFLTGPGKQVLCLGKTEASQMNRLRFLMRFHTLEDIAVVSAIAPSLALLLTKLMRAETDKGQQANYHIAVQWVVTVLDGHADGHSRYREYDDQAPNVHVIMQMVGTSSFGITFPKNVSSQSDLFDYLWASHKFKLRELGQVQLVPRD